MSDEADQTPFFLRRVMLLSLAIHAIVPFFSMGYLHFDEHFQILEFFNQKRGLTPVEAMPWEFGEQMRPWLQIAVMTLVAQPMGWLGLDDPISLERAFRVGASLLGQLTLWALLVTLGPELKARRYLRWFALGLALFWPIPFLHARISSEAVGGSLFLLGMCASLRMRDRRGAALAGLLMGLSFMVRFQMGFAIFGFGMYWLVAARAGLSRMASMAAGLLAGMGVGVACDAWGYGELVFTPWNYFRSNILEGMASSFGVEPFWWYLPQFFLLLGPPLSLLFVLALIVFFVKAPRHIVTWVLVPFLLGHSAVGHKELRFLTPLLPLLPFVTCWFLQWLQQSERGQRFHPLAHTCLVLYAALNLIVLPFNSLRPATLPYVYFEYVSQHYGDSYEVYWLGQPPMLIGGLQFHYYRPRNYKPMQLNGADEIVDLVKQGKVLVLIGKVVQEQAQRPVQEHCRVLVKNLPSWMTTVGVEPLIDETAIWTLYECGG